MNDHQDQQAFCETGYGPVDMVIRTREASGGSDGRRRILPADKRSSVGPFVSLDHFGPVRLQSDSSIEIESPSDQGLVGLIYLFEGEVIIEETPGKRSLVESGAMAMLGPGHEPGSVSYRSTAATGAPELHGVQCRISAPDEESSLTTGIEHHLAKEIPKFALGDVTVTVLLGRIYGRTSPATNGSSALLLICELPERSEFNLPGAYQELGVYVVSGCLEIDGLSYPEGSMAIAALGWPVKLKASLPSRVLIIGGKKIEAHIETQTEVTP